MQALNQLASSVLLLLVSSSCMLDTRPKAHDVCTDDSVYEVTFTEKSGTCGALPTELGQVANSTSKGCRQAASFDENCGVLLHHECSDFSVEFVLDRANGNPDAYIGFAELRKPDCTSIYNVVLMKVE